MTIGLLARKLVNMLPVPTLVSATLVLAVFGVVNSQAQVFFHDDLENGPSNWSVYSFPGSPVCTPLTYVSTATEPNANHTTGGAYGFKMTQASDRMVRDLDLSVSGSAGVHLSLWYYDALNMSGSDFEAFDLRTPSNSQILGFATRGYYYQKPEYYWVRVLKVIGTDPTGGSGYRSTPILRTIGWHHLEIMQYLDVNTAEFYVDGVLALRQTDVVDAALSRLVLGLGWAPNSSQTGYVDDIQVAAIPEPAVSALVLVAFLSTILRSPQNRPAAWAEMNRNSGPT